MDIIYCFVVAFMITVVSIPTLMRYASHLGLVDNPDGDRRVHHTATPRNGGLGIILGTMIPLAFLLNFDILWLHFAVAVMIIVVFGVLDDIYEFGYLLKLFGQALATIVVMKGGIYFHHLPFFGLEEASLWLTLPFSFIFILGVVNAVNFSDGLDGLAGGKVLLVLVFVALLAYEIGQINIVLVSLAVTGGIFGFLRYNTFPARIFMGDAGSQFLGFITVCLSVLLVNDSSSPYSPVLPLLLMGLPIIDVMQLIPVRIVKKLPLPGPDKEHLHHQILKLGFQHYEVVAIIYILQVILVATAYNLRFAADINLIIFFALYSGVILLILYFAHRDKRLVRDALPEANAFQRRNEFLRRFNWFYNYSHFFLALLLLIYVWSVSYWAKDFIDKDDLLIWSFLLAGGLIVISLICRPLLILSSRVAVSIAVILISYYYCAFYADPVSLNPFTVLLVLLFLTLTLAIRMTRRSEFRLDNQDLVLLLVVLAIPQLPFFFPEDFASKAFVVCIIVCLYSIEFMSIKIRKGGHRIVLLALATTIPLLFLNLV